MAPQTVAAPSARAATAEPPREATASRIWQGGFAVRAVHLTVLTGLGVAQPVFTELDDARLLIMRDFGPQEVVLLAVAATLGVPAVLMAIEGLVQLWSRRAVAWLHLCFVAGLAAIFASELIVQRWQPASGTQALLSGLAGVGVAFAYARTQWLRSVLTVLAPLPVLFACLFLFFSPVERLAFAGQGDPPADPVRLPHPVVMIVLDEIQGTSLMNATGEIDEARFPNFARLADRSTWFRNATTVHSFTEWAVPAIVSGRRAAADSLPTTADHERNLFALVSGNPMTVQEAPFTDLCPRYRCGDTASARDVLDVGVRTSVQQWLPPVLADRIEPATWEYDAVAEVERFVSSIGKSDEPALHYLHVLLPHLPYAYLPSGKRYAKEDDSPVGVSGGKSGGRFGRARWPAVQAQQAYLLQTIYTDRLIGAVLDRLEARGIYDRSLVILTADHGVSFHTNEVRREVTQRNFADILSVPLFVKAPGQERGRTSDSFVRNIDAVPTMVDLLDLRSPWRWEGRSVRAKRTDPNPSLDIRTMAGDELSFKARAFVRRRAAAVRAQASRFGTGESGLYRIGPHAKLLGSEPRGERAHSGAGIELATQERPVYEPRSGSIPAQVIGTVVGPRAQGVRHIAVGLNGRIVATTRAFSLAGGRRFSALLPESAFRAGPNALALYDIGPARRLRRIPIR